MNLRFENQGTSTYLVYEVQPTDELDTMTLGMLANNTIPGFAPVTFQQIDTTKYIKFNVTAKVSVAQFFSGPVNKRRLMGVFYGLINAVSSAEDYMLDPNMLLLDLNYMYSDVSTCETVLICLPIMNHSSENLDLGKFFKNVIFNTQFDQTENCGYVAQILNYLNSTPNLSLYDFKNLLDSINKGGAAPAAPQPVPQPMPQPAPQPVPQPVPQPMPQPAPQPAPQPVPQQPAQNWQPVIPQGGVTPPAPQPQQPKNAGFAVPGQQPQAPGGFAVPGQQPQQPPKAPGGFAVPGQQPQQPKTPVNPDEKPMTLMYLMQHYNKENAAIYKAQQDAKKGQKSESAPKQPKPGKEPKKGKQSAPPMPGGFAVPGQQPQAPGGFAVPGQQPQQPKVPGGFAVPGQQPQQPKAPNFAAPQQPKAPAYMPPQPQQPQAPAFAMPQQSQPAPQPIPQPAQPAMPINFGATTVLGGEDMGGTTVLAAPTAAAKPNPYLLRRKNNERIPLNKPVFRIGKEKSYVDYFIADNPAISRSHANIINREGDFFIVDTNSTNHTYVNDVMSPSNAETKLAHGDRVTLGNEEFEFKMI